MIMLSTKPPSVRYLCETPFSASAISVSDTVSGCPAKSKVSSVARAQIGLKEVQRGRELLTLSSDGAQGEQGRDKTSFHGVFHYILRETDILAAKVVHPGPRGE